MNQLFILAPVTLALTLYLIHRLRLPAEKIGLVDIPGGRKDHENHTPLVGGVAMFVAFSAGSLLLSTELNPYRPLFAGMGLLLIVGVLDDLHDLGAYEKFGLQLFAALVLVFWGRLQVTQLGQLPGVGLVSLGWLSIPFTLLCVVGLINAVNMLDGMDGLAGSVVLSMLFWLCVASLGAHHLAATALPVLMGSAVLGFLAFNFPGLGRRCASVFMGDSGSTMLGYALAWFAMDLTFRQRLGVPPVTIAWILALPIFDAVCLMARRLMKGQNPMAADREHLHHIFQRAGFSARATVFIVTGAGFAMGGVGVGGWWLGVPQTLMWYPLLGVLMFHCLLVRYAWRAARLMRRDGNRRIHERG